MKLEWLSNLPTATETRWPAYGAAAACTFSTSGAGEYELSNREVLGFGGTAGYDATLNGKVIDLAMREAVDRLAAGKDAGQWGH